MFRNPFRTRTKPALDGLETRIDLCSFHILTPPCHCDDNHGGNHSHGGSKHDHSHSRGGSKHDHSHSRGGSKHGKSRGGSKHDHSNSRGGHGSNSGWGKIKQVFNVRSTPCGKK